MARPRGFRLNPAALRMVLLAQGISLTELANRSGRSLTTLSGLMQGDHRASASTVAAVATGAGCEPEAIFPEVAGKFVEAEPVAS